MLPIRTPPGLETNTSCKSRFLLGHSQLAKRRRNNVENILLDDPCLKIVSRGGGGAKGEWGKGGVGQEPLVTGGSRPLIWLSQ